VDVLGNMDEDGMADNKEEDGMAGNKEEDGMVDNRVAQCIARYIDHYIDWYIDQLIANYSYKCCSIGSWAMGWTAGI